MVAAGRSVAVGGAPVFRRGRSQLRRGLIAALVLGLLNTLVRPLLVLLTLPVTVLTLGLFLFVINALMFCVAASVLDGLQRQRLRRGAAGFADLQRVRHRHRRRRRAAVRARGLRAVRAVPPACTARALVSRCLLALALALLAGCSTLPRFAPDMARGRLPEVRVEGARGPLSAAESKAVLDRLRARGGGSGDLLGRHLALEEAVVGSPLVGRQPGHAAAGRPRHLRGDVRGHRAARDHINLETYIFEDDEVGQRFADAAARKRGRGCRSTSSTTASARSTRRRAFFDRLTRGRRRVLEFNPVNPLKAQGGWRSTTATIASCWWSTGEIAFTGGINISSVYSAASAAAARSAGAGERRGRKARWRDTHVADRRPGGGRVPEAVPGDLGEADGEPLAPRDYLPQLASARPRDRARHRQLARRPATARSTSTLLSAIANAEKQIYLTNAYFVPDPQLLEALTDAAGRGVDVRLMLPGHTDSGLVFHAGRSLLRRPARRRRADLRAARGAAARQDRRSSTASGRRVGSTNLDWRSFLHNDEVNAVMLGTEFGNQMTRCSRTTSLPRSDHARCLAPAWHQMP